MKSNISTAPNVGIKSPSDYKSHLDRMWALHLAGRAKGAPTVISTFAGAGGSSLGYSMAGYDERLAVEWDDHAVKTFRDNFPTVPVYDGDIGCLGAAQCLDMAGVEKGELDILDGSPPCQGFSTAGHRDIDDGRNQLFREFCRLLEGLQPKVFVMENVSGMVKGKMKLIFAEILRTLKSCGYQVSARLLNAMYFKVPQSRQRMIFVGVRNGLGVAPSHPKPESRPIAVKTVLPDLKAMHRNQFDKKVKPTNSLSYTLNKSNPIMVFENMPPPLEGKYAEVWSQVPPGKGVGHLLRQHKRVWKEGAKFGEGRGNNSVQKIDPDRPSFTLGSRGGTSGFSTVVHWQEPRALSIEEAKIIGSYPSAFRLKGTYSQQWARIGNSVPPLMVEAIGRHIREAVLAKIK